VKDDKYQFCVGDIVIEKDFITIGDDIQMIGIVLDIKHLTFQLNERLFHDRITVLWLDTGEKEEMPAVLVDLISSVIKI
tara:strand:+ start:554 stop:790 length:237 start_codon:yes stop_codon:yes gene_type:complete